MKILFIARKFPPSVGGMERFAFDLSNALQKNIEIKRITWGGSNKLLPIVLPVFFIRACWCLLTDKNIEIIHMQDAVQAPIGWLLHIIFRKPYIVVAHGLDITYNNRFYQTVILPFVRRANAVVSISSATNDEAVSRKVKKSKTHVITLGTHDDYKEVKPDRSKLAESIGMNINGRKLLLTTGRLVKRKGVEWFIRNVLPKLALENKDVLYLIAGTGVERANIERAIQETNMADNVALLGRVDDDVRSILYQSCDVFVMPNIKVQGDMEGFGIVAHEAATAALPVVASNMEGIADALHDNKNGVLVQSEDVSAFYKEINNLLQDESYRKKFSQSARRYTLSEFSWDNIAKKYSKVYEEVIK